MQPRGFPGRAVRAAVWASAGVCATLGCAAPAPQPGCPSAPLATPSAPAVAALDEPVSRDGDPALPELDDDPAPRRGWLGVELEATPDAQAGVLVRAVIPGSPADRAGIMPGDVILRVDGRSVTGPSQVVQLIGSRAPGERVSLSFRRGAKDRLLAASLAGRPDDAALQRLQYVGMPAPGFESLRVAQGAVPPTLGALRGKVVVVEFWSPWCAVCRLLVPVLNDWHARYSAQGVEVIGITTESVLPATATARQLGIEHPVLSDPTGTTTRAYRALAVPTVFVIDQQGTVREVMVGYVEEEIQALEALLDELVAGP